MLIKSQQPVAVRDASIGPRKRKQKKKRHKSDSITEYENLKKILRKKLQGKTKKKQFEWD